PTARLLSLFLSFLPPSPPKSPLFPYTTLFRSSDQPRLLLTIHLTTRRSCATCDRGRATLCELIPARATQQRDRPDTLCAEKAMRSEEHTSELQSRGHLVCRLLLEKKKGQI